MHAPQLRSSSVARDVEEGDALCDIESVEVAGACHRVRTCTVRGAAETQWAGRRAGGPHTQAEGMNRK